MDTLYRSGFIGDQIILTLPLKNADGTTFTPGSDYALIFTAKNYDTDADADAVIQLTTGAGIVHSTSNAICMIHPAATADLRARTLVFDIQAQHVVTGEVVKTAAYGNLRLVRDVTRLAVTSIPVVTTEDPLPFGASGTVTSVSVTTANGVSGSVATGTTTPAITLTLGAITPTSVNGVTLSGSGAASALTIAAGKTFTVSNTLTLTGAESSTLNIGAGGTLGTAAFSPSTDYARSIETKTSDFTAVLGGRYIVESAGVVGVIDPTGTAAGDSFEVWVGSGTVRFGATSTIVSGQSYIVVSGTGHTSFGSANNTVGTIFTASSSGTNSNGIVAPSTSTAYAASRFSIRRRYTGSSTWVIPTPTLSDTLNVGSGTWDGSTFTGAQAFSSAARPTSGGTGTPAATSLITRADGDTRYYPTTIAMATAVQDVTNSSSLTDSIYLTASLDVGTYYVETMEYVGSSSYATAGAKSDLTFTGTGTFKGVRLRGGVSYGEPINNAPTWGGSGESMEGAVSGPASSMAAIRKGIITVTAAGTLKVRFAQNAAVSGHYARLHVGSYLRAEKIA